MRHDVQANQKVIVVIFNVAGLLGSSVGTTREYNLELGPINSPYLSGQLVSGMLKLMRTDCTILLTCSAQGRIDTYCSRCLVPIELPLCIYLEEESIPVNRDIAFHRNIRHIDFVDSDRSLVDNNNLLDIHPLLVDGFTTQLPLARLCSSNCKGICTSCRVDLNRYECRCWGIDHDKDSAVVKLVSTV